MEEDERTLRLIRRKLLLWGRKNYRDYPWRGETDPWLTFLAELLLQRTRASQVEPVFLGIRRRFPTAKSLVGSGIGAVRDILRQLGLHWMAPLFYEIAKEVEKRGGMPPETSKELQALRGVGPYTASAWLSLHRNKRAVIIDSNISRWLAIYKAGSLEQEFSLEFVEYHEVVFGRKKG